MHKKKEVCRPTIPLRDRGGGSPKGNHMGWRQTSIDNNAIFREKSSALWGASELWLLMACLTLSSGSKNSSGGGKSPNVGRFFGICPIKNPPSGGFCRFGRHRALLENQVKGRSTQMISTIIVTNSDGDLNRIRFRQIKADVVGIGSGKSPSKDHRPF